MRTYRYHFKTVDNIDMSILDNAEDYKDALSKALKIEETEKWILESLIEEYFG